MKLPEDLFDNEERDVIKSAKILIDFSKDYSVDEIGELEINLKDACLKYGFTKCKPNDKCKMWERICDHFIEVTDRLYDLNEIDLC